FILDNELLDASAFSDDYLPRNNVLYDVMRVINGVPLFWEAHYQRLEISARLSGLPLNYSRDDIYDKIMPLIRKADIANGNIKLVITPKSEKSPQKFLAWFIGHHYPQSVDYKLGVKTMILNAERKSPNIKLINLDLRNRCNKLIKENNVYEILLVDNENNITEGSRSNVFFIKDTEIITPLFTDVLPGITRAGILEICRSMNLKITERKVPVSEIKHLDGIFISGTSPKVLPVIRVDDFTFSFESILLKRIMVAFDAKIDEYISSH
ncbi:MAG: aminotransferase class IV, partial [Bacteroidota bacterium]|nr:aminotransferase class IV [Bacteroidota bacterium]